MIISRASFDKYFSLQDEAEAIHKDVLIPRIREVSSYLHKMDPDEIYIDKDYISVSGRGDSDWSYRVPIDLLFDENWKSWCDQYHEARNLRYEAESKRLEDEERKRLEAREKEELAKLLAKYPQEQKKTD